VTSEGDETTNRVGVVNQFRRLDRPPLVAPALPTGKAPLGYLGEREIHETG